jgi:GINS complex subunit 2
VRGNFLIFDWE